jgi:streptogramin lyase
MMSLAQLRTKPMCGRRLALEALEDRCLLSTGVSEFTLPGVHPPFSSYPHAIAAGPDGNVWFTDGSALAVGKITPAGIATEFPIPGLSFTPFADQTLSLEGITAGPDGNVWFTEYIGTFFPAEFQFPPTISGSKIAKVTPSGTVTEFQLPNDASAPGGITAGPDGKLWFREDRADVIGSITTDGKIQEFTIPRIGGSTVFRGNTFRSVNFVDFTDITTGPDGNLWYTALNDIVGRISPNGTPLGQFTLSAVPGGITTGPDGNVWVAESNYAFISGSFDYIATNSHAGVARITPAGVVTEFQPVADGGLGVVDITPGPDGNLWFTEIAFRPNGNLIASIRPDGSLVAELPVAAGNITENANGDLWFTQPSAGKIGVLHNYVNVLYEEVLGRSASAAERNYWFNVENQSGQAAVANGIQRSDEAHVRLVAGWYQSYLSRPADAAGLQFFVMLLRTGTEEQALADLLASTEYYNHALSVSGEAGGAASDRTFVQALFQQLLGHAADPRAPAYWESQVAADGRAAAALQLMGTDEYRTDVIVAAYHTLLHRALPPSAAEVNYWLSVDLNPFGPSLPGGHVGGKITVRVPVRIDRESLLVDFEQSEEFALNG